MAATPTKALLPATQLTLAELWMRNPQQPADSWPTVDRWNQEVQMVIDCNDGGHPIEVTMKLWAASTAAERQAWREFGQASFLIGNSGSAWFEYSSSQSTLSWNDTSPLDNADLGAALDTHSSVDGYLRGGVYQRRFQRGIALVNPGTAVVTVQLDQSYRTSGGSLVTQCPTGCTTESFSRRWRRYLPQRRDVGVDTRSLCEENTRSRPCCRGSEVGSPLSSDGFRSARA